MVELREEAPLDVGILGNGFDYQVGLGHGSRQIRSACDPVSSGRRPKERGGLGGSHLRNDLLCRVRA